MRTEDFQVISNDIALLKSSADALAKLVRELEEQASWSPLGKGRTALDQVAECALMMGACVGITATKSVPEFDWAAFTKTQQELASSAEAALEALEANTAALVAALEALTPEEAALEITMPWGATYTLAGLAGVNYWNNTYHQGQITYIQTLAA